METVEHEERERKIRKPTKKKSRGVNATSRSRPRASRCADKATDENKNESSILTKSIDEADSRMLRLIPFECDI